MCLSRRSVRGAFGHLTGHVIVRIVGWLPAEESDYVDEAKNPAALWRAVRDDGDEEDLEEFEVPHSLPKLAFASPIPKAGCRIYS